MSGFNVCDLGTELVSEQSYSSSKNGTDNNNVEFSEDDNNETRSADGEDERFDERSDEEQEGESSSANMGNEIGADEPEDTSSAADYNQSDLGASSKKTSSEEDGKKKTAKKGNNKEMWITELGLPTQSVISWITFTSSYESLSRDPSLSRLPFSKFLPPEIFKRSGEDVSTSSAPVICVMPQIELVSAASTGQTPIVMRLMGFKGQPQERHFIRNMFVTYVIPPSEGKNVVPTGVTSILLKSKIMTQGLRFMKAFRGWHDKLDKSYVQDPMKPNMFRVESQSPLGYIMSQSIDLKKNDNGNMIPVTTDQLKKGKAAVKKLYDSLPIENIEEQFIEFDKAEGNMGEGSQTRWDDDSDLRACVPSSGQKFERRKKALGEEGSSNGSEVLVSQEKMVQALKKKPFTLTFAIKIRYMIL
jgi:hypothetical protein